MIMSILQSEINDQSGKGSLHYKKSVTFVTLEGGVKIHKIHIRHTYF